MPAPTAPNLVSDGSDPVEDLRRRIQAVHRRRTVGIDATGGRPTSSAVAAIEALVDPGTFSEVGRFATATGRSDHDAPGDGRLGGTAAVDGRPVVVAADDPSAGIDTASPVSNDKLERLLDLAVSRGMPFVFLAQGGGLTADRSGGAEGWAQMGDLDAFTTRHRSVPMVSAILGDTTESSAAITALGDLTIQVRGSRLGLHRSWLTVEPDQHRAAPDGDETDAVVDRPEEALAEVRRFLSFLPSNAWTAPPRIRPPHEPDRAVDVEDLVPRRRTRAYDVRQVVTQLTDPGPGGRPGDPGSFLELRPWIGRGLVACLARIDGWPVGILASNPMYQAGSMDPEACAKAIRLLVLCDSFQLPVIFLQDVAGFLVGRQVEHGRMLFRAVRLLNALYACTTPTITVVMRKGFGLAYEALNGRKYHTDGLYTWPGAEIGFMDPAVGVNVLHGDRKTVEEKREIAAGLKELTSPFDAAAVMNIDDVIEPGDTRRTLARDLRHLASRQLVEPEARPLRYWPAC